MSNALMHERLIRLAETGVVSRSDIDDLQNRVFPDGLTSRDDVEILLAIDLSAVRLCETWTDYLIASVGEFVARTGVVSQNDADWLAGCISRQGIVHTALGFELLFTIINHARQIPFSLSKLAMEQIQLAVLSGKGPLAELPSDLAKGMDTASVSLIREILTASEHAGQIALSRDEMDYIHTLNITVQAQANHPAWQDLFVKCAANYVLGARADLMQPRAVALAAAETDLADDVARTCRGTLRSLERVNEACGGGEDIIREVDQYRRIGIDKWSDQTLLTNCLTQLEEIATRVA